MNLLEQRQPLIWKTPLHADALGYYCYLPAGLHNQMRVQGLSEGFLERVKGAAVVDRKHDRLLTQYTYVTALLELPFYLVAEGIEGWGRSDGLSPTHVQLIQVAGIFYWTAALVLLSCVLSGFTGLSFFWKAVLLAAVSLGTPVFYYAFRMPGYSHIYSLFLVSAALWSILPAQRAPTGWRAVLFCLACALIAVSRPLDAIVVVALHLLLYARTKDLASSLRLALTQLLIGVVVLLPQMIYWKHAFGGWVTYSYGQQGFSNWADPRFGQVLFSPENGLLPWGPMFALLPFGVWALWKRDRTLAITIMFVFAAVIYGCAAWWIPSFGCSFGQRSLVQYVPFLLLALVPLARWLSGRHLAVQVLVGAAILWICRTTYFMALEFDICYQGGPDDWSGYLVLLEGAAR